MDGHTQHDPIYASLCFSDVSSKTQWGKKRKLLLLSDFTWNTYLKLGNLAHFEFSEFSWWRNFAESILKIIVFEALVLSIIISRKIWVAVNYLNIRTVYVQKVDWGESCAPIKHLSVNFCKQELWSIFSEDLKLGQLTTQSPPPNYPSKSKR